MTPKGTGLNCRFKGARAKWESTASAFSVCLLLSLSILVAVLMVSAGLGLAWIIGEMLVLKSIGTYILVGFKVGDQWEKAMVLHLRRFKRLEGPGFLWIIPIVEMIPA